MYRLAKTLDEKTDKIIQKVVTEQMISAMQYVLGIDDDSEIQEDCLDEFLASAFDGLRMLGKSTFAAISGKTFIAKQFMSMYKQLTDETTEYNFNAFQEMLLNEIINHINMLVKTCEKPEFSWQPDVSYFEEKAIKQALKSNISPTGERLLEVNQVNSAYDAITNICCMGIEGYDSYVAIWHDKNFTTFYECGIDKILDFFLINADAISGFDADSRLSILEARPLEEKSLN